jgi:hypothetical protein
MGKILVFVIGLVALLAIANHYVRGGVQQAMEAPGKSAPKQTLDNVREAAKRIEVQGQQQADKAAQGPSPRE